MTRTETLIELLPESAPMLPPRDSISSTICAAVRDCVPLIKTREQSFVIPLSSGVFGEDAGLENGNHRDQRQPRILPNQQAQPVRKRELVDFSNGWRTFFNFCLLKGAERVERRDGEVIVVEIFIEDALDVLGNNTLEGGQVLVREIEIVGEQPVRAEVAGLPAYGRQRAEMGAKGAAFRLINLARRDSAAPCLAR